MLTCHDELSLEHKVLGQRTNLKCLQMTYIGT